MAVHKKPANTETLPQKRDPAEAGQKKTEAQSDKKVGQEPVVISDVVTKTTETIEVIEAPVPQAQASNPLSEFKEKMVEEELSVSDNTPKKNFMWPILFIFIITMLLLVGVFLYKQGANTNDKINVVTLTPTPTITPEPTKTIDLTKYEIEIQNGSEVAGEAGRQQANLEAEGFKISAIGNANNSDYTDTIIKAKKEVEKDFIAKLKSFLNESFTVGDTKTLPDDSSIPVVVIIGTKN